MKGFSAGRLHEIGADTSAIRRYRIGRELFKATA